MGWDGVYKPEVPDGLGQFVDLYDNTGRPLVEKPIIYEPGPMICLREVKKKKRDDT